MSTIGVVLAVLASLVVVFSVVWAWQLRTENAGMVDPVWAFSLGAVALLHIGSGTGSLPARLLVGTGSAVRGVRLGWYLWRRNAGKSEDARYHKSRQEWGTVASQNMFGFFQVQVAAPMFLLIAFAVSGYRLDSPGAVAVAIAIVLWLVAVAGEALADW